MFGDILIELNKGATVAELNEKLSEVVAAVRATAKAGAISLTLKVTPTAKGSGDVVFIEPTIKTTIPAPPKGATLFFTTEDNRLSRRDERQEDLPFDVKVVDVTPINKVKEAM